MKIITKNDIAESLRLSGLKNGDLVLMHSALSSIGYVDGGAETVIDAFMEVLGIDGTLAVSTLSGEGPFDVNKTKSGVGAISEALRLRNDAKRSLRPFHSVAAIGRLADHFTCDHDKCETNCGEGSPYTKLRDMGGKVVLLGVDMNRNTTLHAIEDIMNSSYLEDRAVPMPTYIENHEGKELILTKFPPGHRDFLRFTPILRRNGAINEGKVGNAVIKIIDASKMFALGIEALKADPFFFMCENKNCEYCFDKRKEA